MHERDEVHVVTVEGRDDGVYIFATIGDASDFQAAVRKAGGEASRSAETVCGPAETRALIEQELDDEEEDEVDYPETDSQAHRAIRDAIRDSVKDICVDEAVILLYDMGVRTEDEISSGEWDELRERGLLKE